MSQIVCKTSYVFPSGRFERYFLKVVTTPLAPRAITLVFRVSLESMFDDQKIYVADKYDTYDEALDGHDRWKRKAEQDDIPFQEV